jgi:hypothetical protein
MNREKKIAMMLYNALNDYSLDNSLILSYVKYYGLQEQELNIKIWFDNNDNMIRTGTGIDSFIVSRYCLNIEKIMKYVNWYIYYKKEDGKSKLLKIIKKGYNYHIISFIWFLICVLCSIFSNDIITSFISLFGIIIDLIADCVYGITNSGGNYHG